MTDEDKDKGFAALGRSLDNGLAKFRRTVGNSDVQILHAFGLDKMEAALLSVGKGTDAKIAAEMLRDPEINRAHFMEEFDKRMAAAKAAHSGEAAPSTVAPSSPSSFKPQTQREINIAKQLLLKEAGYGDILARHGEKNGGVDGARGGDMIAAEVLYRKDHHLAANADIWDSKPLATPSVPPTGKGPKLREI